MNQSNHSDDSKDAGALVTQSHGMSSGHQAPERRLSRRAMLLSTGATLAAAALSGCAASVRYEFPQEANSRGIRLRETPECRGNAELTIANGEGPFYKRTTPMKDNFLEDGMSGTKMILVGRLLTTDCQPIPGAVIDFWQSNADGNYDNAGYTLRGHQFSDENGMYKLTTIMPASYTAMFGMFRRAPHVHAKVQGRNTKLLTTQIYFPNEPTNQTDFLYRDDLLVQLQVLPDGSLSAVFDFVLSGTA